MVICSGDQGPVKPVNVLSLNKTESLSFKIKESKPEPELYLRDRAQIT